ncbi:hypothetical protein RchiOBHm_Chr5g0079031 [Rosa chinensis]|uniref:Selenoprotein O n=1 Tax=Rosa chinensis TaxID=74649 RepID=A0A2P6QMD4_ROSCH|nr:hypothetical protein RchiOBHm_Chr5g0079031 [Rosa chinensis]
MIRSSLPGQSRLLSCFNWILKSEFERPDFPLLFSGASPLVGSSPYARCYGGHQFGMWAGQLGDGRAITLGEVLNLNLKGGNCSLKVLERPLTAGLQMALLCFVVAFGNSSAVKQCIVLEFQQLVLYVL